MKDTIRTAENTQTDQSQEIDQELKNNREFAISTNSFLRNMYAYPSSELISVRVVAIFLIRCLLIAGNLFTTSLLAKAQPNRYAYSMLLHEFIGGQITMIQVMLVGLNLAIIASFAYLKINEFNPKIAGSKILEPLEIAVELNLHLNGFLLLFGFPRNLPFLVVATLVSLYSSINYRNYIIKADVMYSSSLKYSIVFEGITFLALLLNPLGIYLQNQRLNSVLIIFHSILYVYWYLSGGYKLFIYPVTKICLAIFISLEICCGFINCEYLLINGASFSQRDLMKIILILVCVLFSFKTINDRSFELLINRIIVPRQQDIIQIQLLTKSIKNELPPLEYELAIIGLIKKHQLECQDLHSCVTNSSKLYDSVSKSFISIDKLWLESEAFFKFFLRQQFQSFDLSKQSVDFQLKYCEFMLNEQSNQSIITQVISTLQQQQLNFLQKTQLEKMKQILNKKVSVLNKNLYEGSLQLQNLIISENLFNSIEQKLKSFLHKNITLWKIFSENQLNISSIKKLFHSALKLIKEIDRSWSYLSKYFRIHKRWKYLYINYMLYIKNSKIKIREMEEFGASNSVQKLFKDQKIYYDPFVLQQEIVKNKYLLFDSKTSVFHATMQHSQLFIKRVSQYFTSNFTYKTSEIIGANVSVLLPEDQRKNHMEKVLSWINTGYETNQESYQIKHSNCLDQRGNEIPVLKCFKTFINYYAQQLEYVCLLKKNIKQDDHFQNCFTIISEVEQSQLESDQIGGLIRLQKKKDDALLSQQSNIFIKEDCFLPVEELKELKDIKYLIRLYAFLVTLSILILALLNYQSSSALVAYSREYINFMQTYRLPMLLANDYFKSILQIGNQTQLAMNIKANTELLRSIESDSLTMQTLFDQNINQPAKYYPMKASKINQNSSYNQIQLYFIISSSIATLSNNPKIDTNSRDFQIFHDYLRPGYDNMLNRTKLKFHETFKTTISIIYEGISAAVYIQFVILTIFILISLYKIFSFFQRIKSIVTNIAEFKQTDVKIIYHYWCNTFLIFERLINKNNQVQGEQIKTCHQLRKRQFQMKDAKQLKDRGSNQNVNLNRKEKTIIFNEQANRFKVKMFFLVLLAMIVSFSIVITIQINFIQQFSSITQFQRDGFAFLQYFPAATIVGFGCLQKAFSVQYPHIVEFQDTNYDDVLSDLWLVGNFQYLGSVKDDNSLYYTKQRKYFFENPCKYNPNITIKAGLSVKQCQTIADSSFTRGLTAFMRYAFYQSTACIKGNQLMTKSQLDQFSKSVAVLSAYILDAIVTWGNEFNTRITFLISSFFESSIIEICLIIGIHVVVFQMMILKELRREYKFYRLLYLNMVPQYILVKDKIIKQKFVSDKIIQNS